jgi:tRNA(Phe) wybutosine-synthesizing methylase Tyw3
MNNLTTIEENTECYHTEITIRNKITNENYLTYLFMTFCVDELKSQADRMAQLEKQIAELLGKEENNG